MLVNFVYQKTLYLIKYTLEINSVKIGPNWVQSLAILVVSSLVKPLVALAIGLTDFLIQLGTSEAQEYQRQYVNYLLATYLKAVESGIKTIITEIWENIVGERDIGHGIIEITVEVWRKDFGIDPAAIGSQYKTFLGMFKLFTEKRYRVRKMLRKGSYSSAYNILPFSDNKNQ